MFHSDKTYGEQMQDEFCKILIRRGYEIEHVAVDKFPEWDIMIKGGKTFEIKADKKTDETGNIFIETRYKDKYSGLSGTRADYFVVIARNFAHVAAWDEVCRFILSSPYARRISGAGDNGQSSGFLIKEEHYKPKNMRLYEIGF